MNGPMPVAVTAAAEADFAEIAAALGVTGRATKKRAERDGWPYTEQPVRGGKKRFFALAALPAPVREAISQRRLGALVAAPSVPPIISSTPAPSAAGVLPATARPERPSGFSTPQRAADLTDKQRAERDARASVLAAIRRLQANSGCSQEAAMTTLLTTAKAAKLEPALDALLRQARDPRGRSGDGYPSIRTLKRWLKAPDLAPKVAQKDMAVPAWAKPLMQLYGQPQKPSLAAVMEDLPRHLPASVAVPSYDAANRFLKKLGNVERQRGRMLSREIKNLLPFVRRDASNMTPDAIYTADGHTFDAEVAHPKHGKAFRPEVTTVLSVPSRRCVGWSAGLAESTWAVMDAMRNAVETSGIPAIWYVDNGSGFKNAIMTAEVTGFAGRLGIDVANSLPYNSQARGVEERSHQSIWVRAAKKLPTYMGADMDRQARQKVFKLTRAHLKQTGQSALLIAWADFLRFCQEQIDAYNNRPHRGLPTTRDPISGKRRHMSPNEAWAAAEAEGWQPVLVTAEEAADLFRPEIVATTARGEVRVNGQLYFSRDLQEFTGDKVRVGYDIHNGERVWVRDMAGRLICIAEFEANKRAYFPESRLEQAARQRAETRERRLEVHLQEVRDELNGAPALLEHQASIFVPMTMPGEQLVADAEICIEGTANSIAAENVVALPNMADRPFFTNDPDQYRWLMRNPAQWDANDAGWLLDYVASEDYADLADRYEFQGVAWGNEDDARARASLEISEVAAR